MKIILSQRLNIKTDYEDVPFRTYHFPKRYRNQIHPGDRFIYYQGNRHKKTDRYYFGCGVIGEVEPDTTGESFYAEILDPHRFSNTVPIYLPEREGFIESLGYDQVRNKPKPSWQNSIRKISDDAFVEILRLANVDLDVGKNTSFLESGNDALNKLRFLNSWYADKQPKERAKNIQNYLDRGKGVTDALKSLLGARCQICGWRGFEKKRRKKEKRGEDFIEAHHITQLAEKKEGSLCTENIILLCPNCHREIHYGKDFSVSDSPDSIEIVLSKRNAQIRKNTMGYLSQLNAQQGAAADG